MEGSREERRWAESREGGLAEGSWEEQRWGESREGGLAEGRKEDQSRVEWSLSPGCREGGQTEPEPGASIEFFFK